MDDRRLRIRRLAAAGILMELLEYSACEAVRAAQDLSDEVYRELLEAVEDPMRNRGILRAIVAMEKPRPWLRQPRPYHEFAEPVGVQPSG